MAASVERRVLVVVLVMAGNSGVAALHGLACVV
jgi:hypothetical protein